MTSTLRALRLAVLTTLPAAVLGALVAVPAVGETAAAAPVTVHVLGTAQDGGLPHTACDGAHCRRARREPSLARRVASLGLVVPSTGAYLFDATPDITDQLAALATLRNRTTGGVDREPLAGVLLTHAHIGHYIGLAHLGFEVVNTSGLPVYATPRMATYLENNGPWSQLVELGNIRLAPSPPGAPFEIAPGVTVTPQKVPHRDEFSDTVAFRIEGPERTLLYLPDTEPWRRWEAEFLQLLDGVDFALLDASFYSADELPGRPVESIGHPLVTDTIELLGDRVRSGELEVHLTHMNHSNPLVDPGSAARRAVEEAGFTIAREGQSFDLGSLPPTPSRRP